MHWTAYFPRRADGDDLDCLPMIAAALASRPNQIYGHTEAGETIEFRQLAAAVGSVQRWLASRGLEPGDHVAVILPNGFAHVAVVIALLLSRLVWIPINARLKADGIRRLLEQSRARLLVSNEDTARMLEELRQVADVADVSHALAFDAAATPAFATATPSELFAIIYTSGTSGPPKGVLFTHRMLRVAAEAVVVVADVGHGDRMLVWEPLCHIGGAQLLLLPFMLDVKLFLAPRFAASSFLAEVARNGITHVHYLGGILDYLARTDAAASSPPKALRVFWGAGASPTAWQYAQHTFGRALRECYGMTECASFATVNADGTPMSIGKPLPWLTLRLQDDTGREVERGKAGEIVLESTIEGVLMAGYFDNPEASGRTLVGGRLHTGDLARRGTEHELYFVGRKSDSMRVRGENVSAWEVERVFAEHPSILQVAAVGVPSEFGEQDILLYVCPKPGAFVDVSRLRSWCSERLAPYQVPRYYRLIDAFSLTPSERVRKEFLPRLADGAFDSSPARVHP